MKALITACCLALMASAAMAQTTPRGSNDPLQDICTGFLEKGGAGVSGDRNKLCTCLVRETKARLTAQEMAIYSKATESGQAPPPAIMEKVIGIATNCLSAQ